MSRIMKVTCDWCDTDITNTEYCSHHREKPMNFCEVCGADMRQKEVQDDST